MVDYAADKAAKDRKRKALAQYTGYDDEEFDENRIGQKADILGKYDDEFATGKVRNEGFRLGAPQQAKMKVEDDDVEMVSLGQAPATKVKLNLDFSSEFSASSWKGSADCLDLLEDFEVSDYMKEGDAGFKQRKVSASRYRIRRKLTPCVEEEVETICSEG